MIFGSFLALAALIVAIVAVAQLTDLRKRLENLEANLRRADRPEDRPPVPAPPAAAAVPPPLPKLQTPPPLPVPAQSSPVSVSEPAPGINWESFVGVRLFAWIGGFALFLGVVFFVKYAFDNNLVTPRMRIFSGGLVGVILIIAGLTPALRRYWIPAQSLIVTGLLICYADIYAAHSFYALVSLTVASVLMWLVTAAALVLGARIGAPAILWLALIGGYVTPLLFRTSYESAAALFGYVGVLTCGIVAAGILKRWHYFVLAAAICCVLIEFAWTTQVFGPSNPRTSLVVLLAFQALFLAIAVAFGRVDCRHLWIVAAAAIAGFAPLLSFIGAPLAMVYTWHFGFVTLLLASAGLIALTAFHETSQDDHLNVGSVIVGIALLFICLAEWRWAAEAFNFGTTINIRDRMASVAAWHAAIFLLFALVPYVCGVRRIWTWMIAAIAGAPQFWFVYYYLIIGADPAPPAWPHRWAWIVPIAFALPSAAGILYLVRREQVSLSSADDRLASQGAALLAFLSLVFAVQFHREWITLGWALEGLGLILLFRWLPNRRLRAFALIVLCAAFVRLALNPAVLEYHRRSHTPILNWYLYAYGIAGLCLFASAYWFREPLERRYEKTGPALLYTLSGIVFFLLLNIEIADYFSIGPTLTFSFAGNFARDMTYTISWALFAFALLLIGMFKRIRPVRLAAIALLCAALVKLFLHDLDSLSQLYRIAAFVSVAIIAMVASFAYQRFLSPAKTE